MSGNRNAAAQARGYEQVVAGSAPFSIDLAARDHARLAERLATHIGHLRQAGLGQHDAQAAQAALERFVTEELLPYLHAEEGALYAAAQDLPPSARPGPGSRHSAARRHQEHRALIDAVERLRLTGTPIQTISWARRVEALLNAHLAHEDHQLLARYQPADDDPHRRTMTTALTVELGDALAHDHARIERSIRLARQAVHRPRLERLPASDRAVVALCHHANVMSTRAYPAARWRLPRAERAVIRRLTAELRSAERAASRINGQLRGAAQQDTRDPEQVWEDVERAWRQHTADEERLMGELAPLLKPQQTVALLAALRRSDDRHRLTRPHPSLLHGTRALRPMIALQYRIDRFRDALDNRSTQRWED